LSGDGKSFLETMSHSIFSAQHVKHKPRRRKIRMEWNLAI